MIIWLNELQKYLQSQTFISSKKIPVFIQSNPNETLDQTNIILREFNATDNKFTVPRVASRLQIVVNHKSDPLAYDLSLAIFDLLSENYRITYNDLKFMKIKSIDRPSSLGKRGGAWQYTTNYEVII